MDQLVNVLLANDKVYRVPHRALCCRLGLGGLYKVYLPKRPTSSA